MWPIRYTSLMPSASIIVFFYVYLPTSTWDNFIMYSATTKSTTAEGETFVNKGLT